MPNHHSVSGNTTPLSRSLWKLDFSNVGKQQGGWFKRLTDKQGLAKCQFGQSGFCWYFAAVISAVMKQSLGVKSFLYYGVSEDPSVCSFTCSLRSRGQHKPLPQAACVESTHLFSWKHESSSGYKPHESSSWGTHCAHSEGSWLRSYPIPAHLTHGTSCFALWIDEGASI